jgi:hypothetical protein
MKINSVITPEISLCDILKFPPYLTVNTPHLHYKRQRVNIVLINIPFFRDNHRKRTRTVEKCRVSSEGRRCRL